MLGGQDPSEQEYNIDLFNRVSDDNFKSDFNGEFIIEIGFIIYIIIETFLNNKETRESI